MRTRARPVIVCTEYGVVLFGYATETKGSEFELLQARMAIVLGTTRGVMELAETGPTQDSRISTRASIDVRKVSAVFEVTKEAAEKWEAA